VLLPSVHPAKRHAEVRGLLLTASSRLKRKVGYRRHSRRFCNCPTGGDAPTVGSLACMSPDHTFKIILGVAVRPSFTPRKYSKMTRLFPRWFGGFVGDDQLKVAGEKSFRYGIRGKLWMVVMTSGIVQLSRFACK